MDVFVNLNQKYLIHFIHLLTIHGAPCSTRSDIAKSCTHLFISPFVSEKLTAIHTVSSVTLTCLVSGSLTHWKKWYPSSFSSLKMTPFL